MRALIDRRVGLLLLAAAGTVGCGADDRTSAAASLAECRLPRLASSVRCMELEVPERRATEVPGRPPAAPESATPARRLRIHVAVLPANTLSPKSDPLFMLAGGPGQAASALGPLAASFESVRRERDIVLVDQRGTGRSAPLACDGIKPGDPAQSAIEPAENARLLARCREELAGRGIDPSAYTTPAFVADLEDVRRALGYARVNLWGGSYGTRVALEYLRRHPERVRSVVLDGVVPPSMRVPLDIWPSRDRALNAVLAACAEASDCARALPRLAERLDALRRRLDSPLAADIDDPASGAVRSVRVSWALVVAALHALTNAPESASLVPVLVARAEAGDYAPLVAALEWVSGRIGEELNPVLHHAVVCAEDAPRVDAAEAERTLADTRSAPLGRWSLRACEGWPRGVAGAMPGTPVASDVPVLLLSGALDPLTPPENAALVARTLPNSRQVTASGVGHIVSTTICAAELIGSFVEHAGFERLPATCIEFLGSARRPPPFVSTLGPEARP